MSLVATGALADAIRPRLSVRSLVAGRSFVPGWSLVAFGAFVALRALVAREAGESLWPDDPVRSLRAGGTEVPALGKAAARREPVPGMLQVSAWDDDTPCGIVVTWLGKGEYKEAWRRADVWRD